MTALREGDCENPPEGFRRLPLGEGFGSLVGPPYGRGRDDGFAIGFRVLPRHVNPHGTCHGGVLATFADYQCYVAQHQAKIRDCLTPTVSMTIDYLSPAMLGEWLEAPAELLRATRTMLFSHCLAKAGERPVFRSSGIFKLGRPDPGSASTIGDFFDHAPSSNLGDSPR